MESVKQAHCTLTKIPDGVGYYCVEHVAQVAQTSQRPFENRHYIICLSNKDVASFRDNCVGLFRLRYYAMDTYVRFYQMDEGLLEFEEVDNLDVIAYVEKRKDEIKEKEKKEKRLA